MSVFRLILREIQHRRLGFLLALTAATTVVMLSVAVMTMCAASQRETTRLMREMGFNVLILPSGTNLADFWSRDYAAKDMPEEYVYRLAHSRIMTVRHLSARLQRRIRWRGRDVLLTGVLAEVPLAHRAPKPPLGWTVPRGQVYVGFALAQGEGLRPGDSIRIAGREFQVARCLGERGSKDDIRIYAHLRDVQEILDKPGRINAIVALSCRCGGVRLARVREEIARCLPGTEVTEFRSIAVARAETRRMVERYAAFIIPAVLLVCAVWLGLLALSNVRERRVEIGILRAMGLGTGKVALLFIGKAVLLGVAGAVVGFAAGTALALVFGPRVFPLTAGKIAPMYDLLGLSLVAAPLLCALATYLPTLVAVWQDPAEALRET